MMAVVRLLLAVLLTFLCVAPAALAQERSRAQDPTLNNHHHPPGTATTPLGTLGRVDKTGTGPRHVLLLPGLGFGAGIWADFARRHSTEFTMYAVTFAGFGGTAPHPLPDTPAPYTEQMWTHSVMRGLVGLLDAERIQKVTIIAHWALATQVALRLALDHPDRVDSVVIIGGALKSVFESVPGMNTWTPAQRAANTEALGKGWFTTVTRTTWDDNNFMPYDYAVNPRRGLSLWREAQAPSLPVWIRYLLEFYAVDLSEELRGLKVPTLVVTPGFDDPAFYVEPGFNYMRNLVIDSWQGAERLSPHLSFVTLPQSRLFAMFDQPEALDRVIGEFLGRLDQPRDILVSFTGSDGTPLTGKLTLPARATGPVPVVFYLHGAGPRTYDHAVRYRGADGEVATVNYYDSHAHPLAESGVAFFRISKRGCSADASGRPIVDRAVFSAATPDVLLDDYAAALDVLRARPEIDPARIVLFGSSEGTRLAPRLAQRSPRGIQGLVLTSYAGDNTRTTVEWQNSLGPWRNLSVLVPAAADGRLSRAEYEAALAQNAALAQQVPFAVVDGNKDDTLEPAELARVLVPRLQAIRQAVEQGNDDFLWQNLLNLSSAYLRAEWDGPPTHAFLLPLTMPIVIVHGALDGTTRVEAVHETAAAFAAADRTNLTIHVFPGLDHNLGWTPQSAASGGSDALRSAFKSAIDMLKR